MATAAQITDWLDKLGRLNPDSARKKTRGFAPHKPLLLLAVLDMVEEGRLPAPELPLSVELSFRFNTYWKAVAERRGTKPDVRLPFFHLHTSGCWVLLDAARKSAVARQVAQTAVLNNDFFAAIHDSAFRVQARRKLVARWFSDARERIVLYTMLGLPVPPDDVIAADARLGEASEAKKRGREARFRNIVVPAYDYTCALTAYRANTLGESIVDAAHIHQFKGGGSNDPCNGIALSKNAHWLFDRGLWSLDPEYCVIVTKANFDEAGPDYLLLRSMSGRRIRLPQLRKHWPNQECLAWHREHVLRSESR